MILLCKYIWKYHFVIHYVSVIYLQIMILWDFFQEKTFMCEWWRDGRICVICKRLSPRKRLPSLLGLAWPPSTSLRMVQRAIFRFPLFSSCWRWWGRLMPSMMCFQNYPLHLIWWEMMRRKRREYVIQNDDRWISSIESAINVHLVSWGVEDKDNSSSSSFEKMAKVVQMFV